MNTEEKYAEYVTTSMVKSIEPVVVERASGVTIRATDGRDYLDCFAGIATSNVGHCHPRVVVAAQRQASTLIHCASYIYYAPPVADLAEALARITPGSLQKTFFCTSGAEAIEGALRVAKTYSGKSEVIALQMGFHGRTNGTLAVTGNMLRKTRGGPFMSGVAFAPAPHAYRCRYCRGECSLACADAVEDVIRFETSGDVAAFIAEPVLGEGGIIVPHRDYFARVKDILDQYGILFIADEVQTGFGRTGSMFAIERYGVEPDIMALAKGMAGGFPLGAFIAPPEIADSFRPGEHLSTFGGNPVSCAAGLATIEVLEEDRLPQRAWQLGMWSMERLREMQGHHEMIGDIRGMGLMIGIELVRDRETKEPALPSEAVSVRNLCREQGVLIGVGGQDGNVVRLQPPLVITQEALAHALNVLDEALRTVAEGTLRVV